MIQFRAHRFRALFILFVVLSSIWVIRFRKPEAPSVLSRESFTHKSALTKDKLAQVLGDSASVYSFPTKIDLPAERLGLSSSNSSVHAILQYAFDPNLQNQVEGLLRSYKPDYGTLVAMDASTGRVLSMVSYSHVPQLQGNLALRATFPSASIFKMVTAAAAIEVQKFSANTVIPFNGRNHTLYKNNVLNTHVTRWTRYVTLKSAFAESINTVFGKIGAFAVGPAELKLYADRFGFNRTLAADVPIQQGRAAIPEDPKDAWKIAEAASGYTSENTMSPLQGAMMAAAIVNNGRMMEPYVVETVHTPSGELIYSAEPKVASDAVDPHTAAEIRALMKETVVRGTSRKSFRGFFRGKYANLNVGGKTGSLTGTEPKGRYDWFVGYAENGKNRIAIAALTIHQKLWRVKSSYLARRAIETYFKDLSAAPRD